MMGERDSTPEVGGSENRGYRRVRWSEGEHLYLINDVGFITKPDRHNSPEEP